MKDHPGRHILWVAILALAASVAVAEVTEIGGVGNIFKKRTDTDQQNKTGTQGTAGAKASPSPSPQGRRTQSGAKASPTPQGQQTHQGTRPGAPGRPTPKPAGGAGSSTQAPASTGQVRVVTKGLADSVKTRVVDYSEDALRTSGTAIILSPRRYNPENDPTASRRGSSNEMPFASGL